MIPFKPEILVGGIGIFNLHATTVRTGYSHVIEEKAGFRTNPYCLGDPAVVGISDRDLVFPGWDKIPLPTVGQVPVGPDESVRATSASWSQYKDTVVRAAARRIDILDFNAQALPWHFE